MKGTCIVVVLALILCYAGAVTVKSPAGEFVGIEEIWREFKVRKFRGIPFAMAPVGDLRFMPPVKKPRLQEPFSAMAFGSPCYQSSWMPIVKSDEPLNTTMSEDCLSLNLYTPVSDNANKAVMVFLHGDGLVGGAGEMYDGTKMAALGDVVVVTVNYRLGVLGFYTTGDNTASGNYGLLDQQMSLKWVQENIASFGGDPRTVTIFGESSGAGSVGVHMLSSSNHGLFKRAILQSGSALSAWSMPDPEVTGRYMRTVEKELGCTSSNAVNILACLKALPATKFIGAERWVFYEEMKFPAGARVDGSFLKYWPSCRDKRIRMEDNEFFRSIELLAGANKHEGELSVVMMTNYFKSIYPEGLNKSAFFKIIAKEVAEVTEESDIERLLQRYKSSEDLTLFEIKQFFGDSMFYEGEIKTVERHVAQGSYPPGVTYLYSFQPRPSEAAGAGTLGHTGGRLPNSDGATHGDELAFLFGAPFNSKNAPEGVKKNEIELSDVMIKYWTNFAKTGDPNKPINVPHHWPKYNIKQKKYIELDINAYGLDLRTSSDYRGQYMEKWSDIELRRGPTVCTIGTHHQNWWFWTALILTFGVVVATLKCFR